MMSLAVALILFFGDSTNATNPPPNPVGWNLQGYWGNYLGTPISSNRFITAKHVGGSIGQTFTIAGSNYTTIAFEDDAFGDLRIWKVDSCFTNWATLYAGTNEVGSGVYVFGRGAVRGEEVWTTNTATYSSIVRGRGRRPSQTYVLSTPVFHGWKAGTNDLQLRWGVQEISASGALLVAQFNTVMRGSEACLAAGDSGGGSFLQDGTEWKLCGVNYAVQGPFSIAQAGEQFYGGIFDFGGLWWEGVHFPYQSTPQPAVMYWSKISSRIGWIRSVVDSP